MSTKKVLPYAITLAGLYLLHRYLGRLAAAPLPAPPKAEPAEPAAG